MNKKHGVVLGDKNRIEVGFSGEYLILHERKTDMSLNK